MYFMKVKIYKEKNCAWCEVAGNTIYGRDADEVRKALNMIFRAADVEVTTKTLPKTEAK